MGIQPDEVFSVQRYGELTLAEEWKKHSTFQRLWVMMAALHKDFRRGKPKVAEARLVQFLKAIAKATKAGGSWAGAWELTYLPDLNQSRAGITIEEEASVSRTIRDRAAIAKALEEASKVNK